MNALRNAQKNAWAALKSALLLAIIPIAIYNAVNLAGCVSRDVIIIVSIANAQINVINHVIRNSAMSHVKNYWIAFILA